MPNSTASHAAESATIRRRNSFLPFHLPSIAEEEIAAVVETLRSGWLTTGPQVHCFEQEFARAVGARHAIAVNSATAALHLSLEAIGLQPGDEVIVPTMTFAATAEVVAYFRAVPVLVDCEPETLNLDPQAVDRAVTHRTKAVIPVHFAGHPCDMDALTEIATRRRIKIIEDAAHAFPAVYRGRTVGTIGDLTCFSFYVTKTITTGEGGMVTTAIDAYADRLRTMSLHGISRNAWNRYSATGSWSYDILYPGFKYNLTDLAASIGRQQLKKHESLWLRRQRIAGLYDAGFADVPEISRPVCRPDVQHAWHLYVIRLQTSRLRIGRNDLIEALKQAGIGTSVHFIPLHLHSYYRRRFGYRPRDLPRASAVFPQIVSLPIYPGLTDEDVGDVIDAVKTIVRDARRC